MNRSRLALAAVLSTAAFVAHAETPDPSGQFAARAATGVAVHAASAAPAAKAAPGNSANVWSTRYNPLDSFQSQRTRAEVQADYVANRDRVAAFTREDSGSAFLAVNRGRIAAPVLAGQPVNAQ
jgi:hypothetical protein